MINEVFDNYDRCTGVKRAGEGEWLSGGWEGRNLHSLKGTITAKWTCKSTKRIYACMERVFSYVCFHFMTRKVCHNSKFYQSYYLRPSEWVMTRMKQWQHLLWKRNELIRVGEYFSQGWGGGVIWWFAFTVEYNVDIKL